jgi:putative membrane protein
VGSGLWWLYHSLGPLVATTIRTIGPEITGVAVRIDHVDINTMNEGQLRDQLAAERTRLANERTLLAYIRTALALAGAGAVLLRFFPASPVLSWIARPFVIAGGVTVAVGVYRFVARTKRIAIGPFFVTCCRSAARRSDERWE